MYILKENIVVDFGIVKKYDIAKRIGITQQTLSKILHRKTSCSKAIANYISMLTELQKGKHYTDKKINTYFDEIAERK